MTAEKVEYIEAKIMDWYPKIKPLIKDHWDELGMPGFKMQFRFDIGQIAFLESRELMANFGVKIGDEPIGYMGVHLFYHPYYLGQKFAATAGFYLKPEYRKGFTGIKFIKFIEKTLKEKYNVEYFQLGHNQDKHLNAIWKRLDYHKTEEVFTKKL